MRYTVNNKPVLYKLTCEDQTEAGTLILESWNPVDAASIWTAIDIEHEGTIDDPIPAVAGMEYIKGKYYAENESIYLMNRQGMAEGESVTLYYLPSQLVGIYFEKIK